MKDNKRPLNDEIKASKIKLITDEGEVLGEMSLAEAKQKAKENSLDLMQL
jgi:translation initiation factor IF-3